MKRKQATWIAFSLWATALILAMAGVTVQMVRLRFAILTAQENASTAAGRILPPVSNNFLFSITIEWLIVLIAIAAVGALLHLALDLSERRGQFVAAVTHELRTPLTSMIMYSEMLEKGMVPEPQRQMEYLATLRAEAERLQHLIDNVLIHARLEETPHHGRNEPHGIDELIAGILPRLERRCAQSEFALTVEPPAGSPPPRVAIDPMDFERIMVNLVENATKYGADEGRREIAIAWTTAASRARVFVADAGPGIPPELRRRLFEPFFQVSAPDQSKGGIGLGLAISRRLARMAGGDLMLADSGGRGARFVLDLPVA